MLHSEFKNNILIAIPIFNEEENLENFLLKLHPFKNQVLLIDDASTDTSPDIIKNSKYNSISNKENIGLSGFYKTIINYANENNYSHFITLDSDGQHDPEYIFSFIECLQFNDLVIGNRFDLPELVPESKIASNLFASLLVKKVTGKAFPDVACGFRAINISNFQYQNNIEKFGVIFNTVINHVLKGNNLSFIKIPPIYHSNDKLLTKSEEIISLISVILQYISFPELKHLLYEIENQKNFNFTLFDFEFTAYLIENKSYQFNTNISKALEYYNNLK